MIAKENFIVYTNHLKTFDKYENYMFQGASYHGMAWQARTVPQGYKNNKKNYLINFLFLSVFM